MVNVNRRTFVLGVGAAAGTAAWGVGMPDKARALTLGVNRAVDSRGTTLEQAAAPVGASGYRRLTAGPGYPLIVRTELATASATRDDRRTGLAAIVQTTDLHLVDTQSPMRLEWLTSLSMSMSRPQEQLNTQGGVSLVKRINSLAGGPFSGRQIDCVVSTGDNTDNHESIELDWFLQLMSGGSITPNTGDPSRYEGIQDSGDPGYYNVASPLTDDFKKAGFPHLPGFFNAALASHSSPGLTRPWYSVFGNHDDSIQGMLPSDWWAMAALYTGNQKFIGFKDPALAAFYSSLGGAMTAGQPSTSALLTRTVTPDSRRRPFTPTEYIKRHLDPAVTGPGPFGHGFTADNAASGRGYYRFPIAPGVVGLSLDSTNRAGWVDGSIGDEQWRWLEAQLKAGSSTSYDVFGFVQKRAVTDTLFVVFSHHTSTTMGNILLDPAKPFDLRHAGSELVSLLQRYPNVIAWVNGHTHYNRITPQRHSNPKRSFWEINTASHIDYPQHARVIDVCDNADGTLSIFTTLLESAAPYAVDYSDLSQTGLASLYREFAFNDPKADPTYMGGDADRNTELLLVHPLR